jgi:hypothetical protein
MNLGAMLGLGTSRLGGNDMHCLDLLSLLCKMLRLHVVRMSKLHDVWPVGFTFKDAAIAAGPARITRTPSVCAGTTQCAGISDCLASSPGCSMWCVSLTLCKF